MKKKIFGKKLSRDVSARRGLYLALTKALIEKGKVITTKAKSKAVQPDIDKLINWAKQNTLSARRRVYSILGADKDITNRIFSDIAPSFAEMTSGYTKIINLPKRKGDNAPMVIFEWTKKIEIKSERNVDKLSKKENKKKKKDATKKSKK